ncbi:MAG: sugar phosphate isomerase/epimerase [Chloroflexi bacterium]|nr:sugar phosphate isomerase/epimerase [Chloroflexota bacterium]
MQVGIDSYSYHRRYGEARPGEHPPTAEPWPLEPGPVLRHAHEVGADVVFLETCYLPEPEAIDPAMLADAGRLKVGFSWGHPWPAGRYAGLDGGRWYGAERELARWIETTTHLGQDVLRITAGSPASRGDEPAEVLVERLVGPVRRAADHAADRGVRLALENHGDLRVADILALFDLVDRPASLGVCLDNVNLIRVGDDMLEGTRALAPHTLLVQLKDHEPGDPTVPGGPVCTALGDGVADLPGVLTILAAVGFDGPVCVELASLGPADVDELTMIERSVRWLRANVPSQVDPGANDR